MKIGTRLKQYRISKGFSIYKLSKETDISQNHISAIENDKRQPTVETLERLVAPLGITLSELFNVNSDISFLSAKERTLIENYRNMVNQDADIFLSLSNSLSQNKKK